MSIETKKEIAVQHVMLGVGEFPVVQEDIILKEALEKMLYFNLGVVCVVDKSENFIGLITDGDIRRILLKVQKPLSALFMEDIMDHVSSNPTTILPNTTIFEATKLIGIKKIWDLPVLSDKRKLLGLFHLHKALEFYMEENR